MNKRKIYCFIFVLTFILFGIGTNIQAKQQDFFCYAYSKTGSWYYPHLQVFFVIPHNAKRIEQKCFLSTWWTNHGHVSEWDLSSPRYIGKNLRGEDKDVVILLIPKSFWLIHGEQLATMSVFLRVNY